MLTAQDAWNLIWKAREGTGNADTLTSGFLYELRSQLVSWLDWVNLAIEFYEKGLYLKGK